VLRDLSQCNIPTKILGHEIAFPVVIAPTAMLRPIGEDMAANILDFNI